MSPLNLLAIAFFPSLISALGGPPIVGGYNPISRLNDPSITDIAVFAVTEHNRIEHSNLKFLKVVKGEQQVVAGMNYRLVIVAEEEEGGEGGKYEAVVYVRPWEHLRSLTSFVKV
ncbi:Cysteine proteinase inhibitor 1-like protein [Drosera capensis]